MNYIIHLKKVAKQSAGKPKKGEISVNSIKFYLAGVQSFLEFNEIVLPWKKIAKFYPEDVIILIGHTRKVFEDLIYEAEGKVTNMRVVSVE